LETAFQAGMAAGAAALLAPGTSLCQAVDVFDLMKVAGCEPV
jgi:6-phosphofructokinase 2